jgi:hypothetical protein
MTEQLLHEIIRKLDDIIERLNRVLAGTSNDTEN